MTKKPTLQPQDKYVLRMPDGLRDRIKAVAEREGTSMNHEIIRVLEREFPEQWPLEQRLNHLGKLVDILRAGKSDPRIEQFIYDFQETVEGIISGRTTGVDLETREALIGMWSEYLKREDEEDLESIKTALDDYTPDEARNYTLVGRAEKLAVLPPRRREIEDLNAEERDEYLTRLAKLDPSERSKFSEEFFKEKK